MTTSNQIEPVYITDLDGNVIEDISLTDIESKMPTRLISSPIEDGSTRFDNKVIDPELVYVKGFITSSNSDKVVYKLHEMKNSRDMKFCSVFSKFDVYENLSVEDFSISDSADMFDVSKVTIRLKQVLITKSGSGSTYCGSKNFVPA